MKLLDEVAKDYYNISTKQNKNLISILYAYLDYARKNDECKFAGRIITQGKDKQGNDQYIVDVLLPVTIPKEDLSSIEDGEALYSIMRNITQPFLYDLMREFHYNNIN